MVPRDPKMHSPQYATIRWASSLIIGLIIFVMNTFGVWIARRNALEVNGIELSALWYAFALFAPGLSVVLAISIPRTHWVWDRDLLTNVLGALTLASFIHVPMMYVNGGFK